MFYIKKLWYWNYESIFNNLVAWNKQWKRFASAVELDTAESESEGNCLGVCLSIAYGHVYNKTNGPTDTPDVAARSVCTDDKNNLN